MIVQMLGLVPEELQITPDRDARLEAQAAAVGAGSVARLLDLLAAALDATKNGSDARTQLELALVKAAAPAIDPSTQALLQRVERLEHALRGVAQGAPTAAPASRAEPPAQAAPPAGIAPPPAAPAPSTSAPVASVPPPPGPAVPVVPDPPSPPAVEPDAIQPAAAVAVADVALELRSLRAVWPAVLDGIRAGGNALCAALLADARPIAVDGTRVTVAFAPDGAYNLRKAEDDEYRACVAEAIRVVTGERPQIDYVLAEEHPAAAEPAAPPTDSEWVERFVAEFDAEEIHPESEAS
jgi:DNA polymerase-3 subunit gamma/tau